MKLEQAEIQAIAQSVAALITPQTHSEPEIMTVEELAEYLKVDKSWVYRAAQLNEVPHFKAGKYTRFRRREIEKWIDGEIVGAIAPAPLIVNQRCRGKSE